MNYNTHYIMKIIKIKFRNTHFICKLTLKTDCEYKNHMFMSFYTSELHFVTQDFQIYCQSENSSDLRTLPVMLKTNVSNDFSITL